MEFDGRRDGVPMTGIALKEDVVSCDLFFISKPPGTESPSSLARLRELPSGCVELERLWELDLAELFAVLDWTAARGGREEG